MLNKELQTKTYPVANAENILLWRDYRITVLLDGLFRLEKSKNGFLDKATQSVFYRNMPKQYYENKESEDSIIITTSRCSLVVKRRRKDCYAIINDKCVKLTNSDNLKGTYRTLDNCDGDVLKYEWDEGKKVDINKRITLDDGVCSRTGVAVFDDSDSLILTDEGKVVPRCIKERDEYIFVYGKDYLEAVKALYTITGFTPMIPKYALGNWWSRYYAYSDREYLALMNTFKERNVPISVSVLDMDWHYSYDLDEQFKITESGKNLAEFGGNNGWTGYSFNKKLFPDYKRFLKELKNQGVAISLNVHPALGVRWFEDMYGEMADAVGIDKRKEKQIEFDLTDEKFTNAYFDILHRPYEKDGVDFWWIDWQQGQKCKISGLDPLYLLNHYHFSDNAKEHKYPLILSRYSGVGSHRYPVGFSGDTYITWKTLKYLPYFTATSANIGYTWWSHDVGGHQGGIKDDELYVRSVQFGVFSPINRLHSMVSSVITKEPWAYSAFGLVVEEWLRLRYKLVPFLYSASYRTHKLGMPLIQPLYYHYPIEKCGKYKNEYVFGEELLVAPITKKGLKNGYSESRLWLPKGRWTDIFNGDEYDLKEDAELVVYRDITSIPVFIKGGSVLPKYKNVDILSNDLDLEISIYNGDGEYVLYENDDNGEYFTSFKLSYEKGRQRIKIVTDDTRKRTYTFKCENIKNGDVEIVKDGNRIEKEDYPLNCLSFNLVVVGGEYEITVSFNEQSELDKVKERIIKKLTLLELANDLKIDFVNKLQLKKSVEECKEMLNDLKVFDKKIILSVVI